MPKFLTFIMAFLVCLALIRAVNGAEPLSIQELLEDVQSFEFDFDGIKETVNFFKDKSYNNGSMAWDDELGTLENIGNAIKGFFTTIYDVISVVVKGLWNIITETVRIIGSVLYITFKLIGVTE